MAMPGTFSQMRAPMKSRRPMASQVWASCRNSISPPSSGARQGALDLGGRGGLAGELFDDRDGGLGGDAADLGHRRGLGGGDALLGEREHGADPRLLLALTAGGLGLGRGPGVGAQLLGPRAHLSQLLGGGLALRL